MRGLKRFVFTFFLAACAKAPTPRCDAPPGPVVDPVTVCEHLAALGCGLRASADSGTGNTCLDAYTSVQASADPEEFARLTNCYVAAPTCDAIALCSIGCVAPAVDAGADAEPDAAADADTEADAAVDAATDADTASDASVDAQPDATPVDDAGP